MTLALILIFINLEMAALQRRLRRLRQQQEPIIIIETYRRRETFFGVSLRSGLQKACR
jgi:hypothetical protein